MLELWYKRCINKLFNKKANKMFNISGACANKTNKRNNLYNP